MEVNEALCNQTLLDIDHYKEAAQAPHLAHDFGQGARCLKCGPKCSGFNLHYWRKICRNCRCTRECHDIASSDASWWDRIGRLLDVGMQERDSLVPQTPIQLQQQVVNSFDSLKLKSPTKSSSSSYGDTMQSVQPSGAFVLSEDLPPPPPPPLPEDYSPPSTPLPPPPAEITALQHQTSVVQPTPSQTSLQSNLIPESHTTTVTVLPPPYHAVATRSNVIERDNQPGRPRIPSTTHISSWSSTEDGRHTVNVSAVPQLTPTHSTSIHTSVSEERGVMKPQKFFNNNDGGERRHSETVVTQVNTHLTTPNRVQRSNSEAHQYISKFVWYPSNASPEMAQRYMSQLPLDKQPIKGSEAAQDHREQRERQIPRHDLDPSVCDDLTSREVEKQQKFIERSRQHAAGIGELVEVAPGSRAKCEHCGENLNAGEVAIVAPRLNEEASWHPLCFQCCQCNQMLVDLIYFLRKGKLYCGRHYAESVYPRCAACDELIFALEYTQAEGLDWHVKHFCCWQCDTALAGLKYIAVESKPYCLQCHDFLFPKTCISCDTIICAEERRISLENTHWHVKAACFRCGTCHVSLVDKQFLTRAGSLFCSSRCKKSAA